MREACRMTAEIRDICAGAVAPGVTTGEIDDLVADYCSRRNVKASFYKYMGFPGHLCVSLNDEVIHGIPSRNRVIMPGDLVKTDVGIFKNGFRMAVVSVIIMVVVLFFSKGIMGDKEFSVKRIVQFFDRKKAKENAGGDGNV